MYSDGIHLSADGSKIVVKEILKVLKEADWEPSLYYTSLPPEFGEDSPNDPISADGKTTVNISRLCISRNSHWDMCNGD